MRSVYFLFMYTTNSPHYPTANTTQSKREMGFLNQTYK